MTMAVQDAPCWQGGFSEEEWRSLVGTLMYLAKALAATCWFKTLDMDLDFERLEKRDMWV